MHKATRSGPYTRAHESSRGIREIFVTSRARVELNFPGCFARHCEGLFGVLVSNHDIAIGEKRLSPVATPGPHRQEIKAGDVRAVLMDKGPESGDTLNTTDTGGAFKHNGS